MNMENVPVAGEIWEDTKTKGRYQVIGASFNSITDRVDVAYEPLYDCEYRMFTCQMMGHPKAWLSKNEDGTPRFKRVLGSIPKYKLPNSVED